MLCNNCGVWEIGMHAQGLTLNYIVSNKRFMKDHLSEPFFLPLFVKGDFQAFNPSACLCHSHVRKGLWLGAPVAYTHWNLPCL